VWLAFYAAPFCLCIDISVSPVALFLITRSFWFARISDSNDGNCLLPAFILMVDIGLVI